MGIPRFYRWLRDRYPLIRMDLTDENVQIPQIDNFYIDFNALIYRCVRQEGTFLRNKLQPLSIQQIYQRVIEYLNYLFETIRPTKLLYIALDGVAPRAKINQSRDRRFKSIKDSEMFADMLKKSDIKNLQNFKNNSISPGTQFLVNLCEELKKMIMHKIETDWRHLNVFFSDCNFPGQGQHKIMDFLRFSTNQNLFSEKTTHCIYSPDADVILLSLGMGLKYVCLIKEDTMLPQANTGYAVQRWIEKPQFELVMVNIVAQYLQKQFAQCLLAIPGSKIADIIGDFILLMAFVGNDFLPSQFCFTLKQGHMDQLFDSYKKYLLENKQFIVREGIINWQKVHKILQIATIFQASMIDSKIKSRRANKNNPQFQRLQQNQADKQLDLYEVVDQKITKGKQSYYKTRFDLKNIQHSNPDPQFFKIIKSYIQGLEFYCRYYFLGLPSWNWYYPYHYTPLLIDVLQYIKYHKIDVTLNKSAPFDPFFALMFMLPQGSFSLLPQPIKKSLMDPQCPLRSPFEYYPKHFELDKYQTIQYSRHAIIPFLPEQKVRQIYNKIKPEQYTNSQKNRNKKSNTFLFYTIIDQQSGTRFPKGIQFESARQVLQQLKKLFLPALTATNEIKGERFPSLDIFQKWDLGKNTISTTHKYKYEGNMDVVFFNNFLGYVDNFEKCNEQMKVYISKEYQKIGITGNCENYFIIKQAQYIRGPMKFNLVRSRRQVIVPDFALFKVPKYSYLPKQNPYQDKQLYEKGERVTILNYQNFGAVGVIQQLQDKVAKVRITDYGYKLVSKPQHYEAQFYTMSYVLNKFDITFAVLLKILDQIIILPTFEKKIKILRDYIPNNINLGLSLISRNKIKIVPQYIRCRIQYQNTQKPWTIFESIELSQSCIELLQQYIDKFSWLVDYLENNPQLAMQRQVKISAKEAFPQDQDYNIRLINEYQKLFELKYNGLFYSIYSKISNGVVDLQSRGKPQKIMVQLPYHQIISKRLAYLSPPPLKHQPEYHDIGDIVIYLKGLATGVITSIDDNMVYVYIAKRKKTIKINFKDAFNVKWLKTIERQNPMTWNMQPSYYTPTYWKKAIDSQK